MSTRKLIVTAIMCGLLIVFAGGFKLLQVATDDVKAQVFALKTQRSLADMTVSVDAVEQLATNTIVTVSMVGVDGADAREGWRLLAGGKVVSPLSSSPSSPDVACATTRRDVVTRCALVFTASQGSVIVAYLRAGEQSQWAP